MSAEENLALESRGTTLAFSMEHGEPPGQSPDAPPENQPPESPQNQKPVRISVAFDFAEVDTGIVAGRSRGVVYRPLESALDNASVRLVDQGKDRRPYRKTIAVVLGVIATRINGHVRYAGSMTAITNHIDEVHFRLTTELAALQALFKHQLEHLVITTDPPLEAALGDFIDVTVESDHETPGGNGERRENDRDCSGAGDIGA